MTMAKIFNTKIAGVSCAVPNNEIEVDRIDSIFTLKEIEKISNMVGVKKFYRVRDDQTTADLCVAAAEKLLDDLKWGKESIEGVIFVSQTPDYIIPATSHTIQKRLGLSDQCLSFDVNLGCSGYLYGLLIASQFIQSRTCNRILLLVGDTISKVISPEDRSVALLFGDAGSATCLEYSEDVERMTFIAGSDGNGSNNLIVPAGGFRTRRNESTNIKTISTDGNSRSLEDLYMNGKEIFNFTLERVPNLIQETLIYAGLKQSEVDYFVMHQANKFILDYLGKKVGIDKSKMPTNLERFGNTSSASIPLVLIDCLSKEMQKSNDSLKLCLVGFGVGYSWAASVIDFSGTICSELVYC